MNQELVRIVENIARDKKIDKEYIFGDLEEAMISAIRKHFGDPEADISVLHQPYTVLCERIKGGEEHYHIDLVYQCKIINEENSELCHNPRESQDIKFFGLEDLEDIKLFPNFRKLVEKILKQNS